MGEVRDMAKHDLDRKRERSTPEERRSFGIWVVVFVVALFVIPVILKWAGLLPVRLPWKGN